MQLSDFRIKYPLFVCHLQMAAVVCAAHLFTCQRASALCTRGGPVEVIIDVI